MRERKKETESALNRDTYKSSFLELFLVIESLPGVSSIRIPALYSGNVSVHHYSGRGIVFPFCSVGHTSGMPSGLADHHASVAVDAPPVRVIP